MTYSVKEIYLTLPLAVMTRVGDKVGVGLIRASLC